MKILDNLNIKIFGDGADMQTIKDLNKKNYIKGFTTNPSLIKKAGVKDYKEFAVDLLSQIKDKPISFEVFADDAINMERQAEEIASWGENVYAKIPITNTKGDSSQKLIKNLNAKGIKCNITAIFTVEQAKEIIDIVDDKTNLILSIFAGRIADSGVDPISIVDECIKISKHKKNIEILWASTREVINIFQADKINCHIITVPSDILKKFKYLGKDQTQFSQETVIDFYEDAKSAGYKI
jgi:transaldolase